MRHTFHRAARALGAALLVALLVPAHAAPPPAPAAGLLGFYRFASLHGDEVWFTAEGDVWHANLADGRAQRVTTHPGAEIWPVVSPDGRALAFVGSYEGPQDAYVMPTAGGLPKRLTWDGGGVRINGWTPRGEVLLTRPSRSGLQETQLHAIDPVSGADRILPVAQASDGALSADGHTLYFTRDGVRGDNARAYRGGSMSRLWAIDVDARKEATPVFMSKTVGDVPANDRRPMPYATASGERIAFLSDRSGAFNVWSTDARGGDLRQHTAHVDDDVRSAAVDGHRVVYALGADLWLVDLEGGAPRKLDITLSGDFDQQRLRWVRKPQDFLGGVALAPDGQRAVIGVRGHLATQGVGALRRAELPQAPDTRCRDAAYASDSRFVFALCDRSGEFEIWRLPADGVGDAVQLTHDASAERVALYPSPDGHWLAHTDRQGRLMLSELSAPKARKDKTAAKPEDATPEHTGPTILSTRLIDRSSVTGEYAYVVWSRDSSALALVRPQVTDTRSQLLLHLVAERRTLTLTSDRYDTDAPAFSPDGRWLYFLSDRAFAVSGPHSPWGDRNLGPTFDQRTRVYALALQPGHRFPFQPDDELGAADAAASSASAPASGASSPTAASAVKPGKKGQDGKAMAALPAIVADGLAERLYEVPGPAGNYRGLLVDDKRLYLLERERGADDPQGTLRTLAIDNDGAGPEMLSDHVRDFELTPDGKKLMLLRGPPGPTPPELLIVDAASKLPPDVSKSQVRWTDWALAVDPRAEWRQMYYDAWRLHRDRFFDPRMRGVDWDAQRRRLEPLLDRVTDRAELTELLAQLISPLSTLHSQTYSRDLRSGPEDVALAGLGARTTRVAGGFRIEAVLRGDPELPSERPPLAAPGLDVHEGDVITAVNGRAATTAMDLSELLRGQAGRQVLLSLRTTAGQPRRIIVVPVPARREEQLRLTDWESERARRTLERSQGRYGYLHIRAMGEDDIATFAREFYTHLDREGLIIDVRGNNGGNVDSWIIEKLLRRAWAFWRPRTPQGALGYTNMQQTFRGQLVVLVDQNTYSDGETFAAGIQKLGLAPLIGRRTSGAGVFLSDSNRLLDNGAARAAEYPQFGLDGTWLIEGHGVDPDIEVDNLPRATFDGGDAQLDAALAELDRRVKAEPMVPTPRDQPPIPPAGQPAPPTVKR